MGEFAQIRQHLEWALCGESSWFGDHDVLAMLVDVASQQPDEAAIRHYAPQAEALAERYGHALYQGIVHRGWGVAHRLAGEYAQSEQRLQAAMDIFLRLGTRWQVGRTRFALGELARSQEDKPAAREAFTLALKSFEQMRAAPDIARTHDALATVNQS